MDMGDVMSFGEQAYKLFMDLPRGLALPETLLAQLQNKMNDHLGYRGSAFIRLEDARDLKTLPEAAAIAAIAVMPTMKQLPTPSAGDIASML
ncbi:hypothetical protein K8R04_04765 [Candidatus Uhrbacteria bacterium]|nr:hypothetical protein [Candidatus Uhrbacteria bacterium]